MQAMQLLVPHPLYQYPMLQIDEPTFDEGHSAQSITQQL